MNAQSKAVVLELALFASADIETLKPELTQHELDVIESKLRTYVKRNIEGEKIIYTLRLNELNLYYRREIPLAWESN